VSDGVVNYQATETHDYFLGPKPPLKYITLKIGSQNMHRNLKRDIRDQVAKLCEIAPKFDVFGPPNVGHPNL